MVLTDLINGLCEVSYYFLLNFKNSLLAYLKLGRTYNICLTVRPCADRNCDAFITTAFVTTYDFHRINQLYLYPLIVDTIHQLLAPRPPFEISPANEFFLSTRHSVDLRNIDLRNKKKHFHAHSENHLLHVRKSEAYLGKYAPKVSRAPVDKGMCSFLYITEKNFKQR